MNQGFVLGCGLVEDLRIVCFAILIRVLVKADIEGIFNKPDPISVEKSLSNFIQSALWIYHSEFVSSGVKFFDLRTVVTASLIILGSPVKIHEDRGKA